MGAVFDSNDQRRTRGGEGRGRRRTLEEGDRARLDGADATLEEFRLEEAGGERDLDGSQRVVGVVGHVESSDEEEKEEKWEVESAWER